MEGETKRRRIIFPTNQCPNGRCGLIHALCTLAVIGRFVEAVLRAVAEAVATPHPVRAPHACGARNRALRGTPRRG